MRIISDITTCPWPGRRSVITIGVYDGVHRGHRAVIGEVRRLAAQADAVGAVVTFSRHPARVVRPESAPALLADLEQRLELLAETGLDATVVLDFDEQQSRETPEAFVHRVIVNGVRATAVVVGDDFRFGVGRSGTVDLLRELGRQHDFTVVPVPLLVRQDGVAGSMSSTSIRAALTEGDVGSASDMLGRLFEVRGMVATGDQRGRHLGFPTANVEVPGDICLPAEGVYAGWYLRPDGSRHACAINLGRRPTFVADAAASRLEVHLLDFTGDLYGERARVQFSARLRPERAFSGVDALKEQLRLDCDQARSILGR